MTHPELSLVFPSFRGSAAAEVTLPLVLDHLRSQGIRHEIIVVDDGSDDGGRTARVAESLSCRCLENPRNQGKGAAVRQGMLAARGRFRVFTDIDLPYDLESLDRLLRCLMQGGHDFVAGDRTLLDSADHAETPRLRKLLSQVFSTFVARVFTDGWSDTQCGMKGFRDEVARDLFSTGQIDRFAFDVELFCIAARRRYRIGRVPVRLRSFDTSSVRLATDGAVMLRDLILIRRNLILGRYGSHGPATGGM